MSDADALRVELHATREAGDISISQYLAELKKLRDTAQIS